MGRIYKSKINKILKQIECNHNYIPWANIYGDLINDFNGKRTVMLCPKCGKRKYIDEYIEAPLIYNTILELLNNKDFNRLSLERAVRNKNQYFKLFKGEFQK